MILAFNKPKGITSNKFLSQIKKITGIKKVGHAGTLDPLATGVLVVAIGRGSTKKISLEVKKEKAYLAEIELGTTSLTDDSEGPFTKIDVKKIPDKKEITKIVSTFIGVISQTPPPYSAVKISGVESYKLARKGELVKIKPRQVEIKKIDILEFNYPKLTLGVVCGPGVYIRSLARDIGQKLKTGGYIAELERTRVGKHTLQNCTTLEKLKNLKIS